VNAGRVIVPGAGSQIGVFAIPALLSQGYEVSAVSRQGRPVWCPELSGLEWIKPGTDIDRDPSAPCYLLSTGPLELAEQWLGTAGGIQRVVAFSTTSVLTKADSPDHGEREKVRTIAAKEKALASKCGANGSELCLLRPSLVYGCGMDSNISLIARWISRFGFFPLSRKAGGLRQPVHAQDLAQVAVRALVAPGAAGLVTALGGGSTLPYRRMVERVFEALGKPARLLELPGGVLAGMAQLARGLGITDRISAEMVHRQERDLVFDDEPARRVLDWEPRCFSPAATDFFILELTGLCDRT